MRAIRTIFLALLLCWFGAAAADVPVPPLTGRGGFSGGGGGFGGGGASGRW